MIDEDWLPAPKPEPGGLAVRALAIVPMPVEMGGSGEVLGLFAFGNLKLPAVDVRAGEGVYAAASRAVLGMAGVGVTPERLLYVVEQIGKHVTLCVMCTLRDGEDPPDRPGVRFVPPGAAEEVDPPALRELLVEDGAAGFVRPVAHVAVGFDEQGREKVTVTW